MTLTFTVSISTQTPAPDFTAVTVSRHPTLPSHEQASAANAAQREWLLDQSADLADMLRLLANRIQRGEKSGTIRTVEGEPAGKFEVTLK